jgi:hypothetical protein
MLSSMQQCPHPIQKGNGVGCLLKLSVIIDDGPNFGTAGEGLVPIAFANEYVQSFIVNDHFKSP